jgi:hypothetical protein
VAASRSNARNRLPWLDQPRFKSRRCRKMFGPNSPPERWGMRCPPVHQRAVGIGRQRESALVGNIAFADCGWCYGPCRQCAILLLCRHGARQVEQVAGSRLHELQQRAIRELIFVTLRHRIEQRRAKIGRCQRHPEATDQTCVVHRQPGRPAVLPGGQEWASRSAGRCRNSGRQANRVNSAPLRADCT